MPASFCVMMLRKRRWWHRHYLTAKTCVPRKFFLNLSPTEIVREIDLTTGFTTISSHHSFSYTPQNRVLAPSIQVSIRFATWHMATSAIFLNFATNQFTVHSIGASLTT